MISTPGKLSSGQNKKLRINLITIFMLKLKNLDIQINQLINLNPHKAAAYFCILEQYHRCTKTKKGPFYL